MKKSILLLFLLVSSLLKAQQEKSDPLIVNFEGVYGLGAIYDDEKSGGVGLGAGIWLPFKDGFIELGIDLTSSASRNHGELQMLYNYPFNLIADSIASAPLLQKKTLSAQLIFVKVLLNCSCSSML